MDNFQLTEHFGFFEMTDSREHPNLVEQNRIAAVPHKELLRDDARILLEPIRNKYGCPVEVTSAFRCLTLNEAVKSKPTSQHLKAEAVDFVVPGHANEDVLSYIYWESGIPYGQLIIEGVGEKKWIHISRGEPLRPPERCRECLKFDGHEYLPYVPPRSH